MPRRPRLDAPGCLHHVIVRGIERRAIFVDDIDRERFVKRLAGLVKESAAQVLAWSLLPNHFHLLLRTGSVPLSDLMRCLNTGYAVEFNRRHLRSGYLFQNRFKSILVEEEPYLLQLVRYIHLNPIRASLVSGLEQLDDYAWTGHSALVGHIKRPWQASATVLALFARREQPARERYRRFVADGVGHGRRPELSGGGLRRSRRGWLKRTENVRGRDLWAFDERILGSSEFVDEALARAESEVDCKMKLADSSENRWVLTELVRRVAALCGTTPAEIMSPSHRPAAVTGRALVSYICVIHLGLSLNATARFLDVKRHSVHRSMNRADRAFASVGSTPEQLIPRTTGRS